MTKFLTTVLIALSMLTATAPAFAGKKCTDWCTSHAGNKFRIGH
jgi:hypothetical protein